MSVHYIRCVIFITVPIPHTSPMPRKRKKGARRSLDFQCQFDGPCRCTACGGAHLVVTQKCEACIANAETVDVAAVAHTPGDASVELIPCGAAVCDNCIFEMCEACQRWTDGACRWCSICDKVCKA